MIDVFFAKPTRQGVAGVMLATLVLGAGLTSSAPPVDAGPQAEVETSLLEVSSGSVKVIVQAFEGAAEAAERAVRLLDGQVTVKLPLVGGFAARLPAAAIEDLAASTAVRVISEDRSVRVMEAGGSPTPTSVYPEATKADQAWRAGLTGQGVTVALIDTGVADVADLAGRIVPVAGANGTVESCKNFSGEAGCDDSYGHGTFMAGIIAGNAASSGGIRKGIAPAANVLSVKLAGRDGSADVSSLLAAIQWVVSYRDLYGIRVLNLSMGTNSTQSYRVSPLNYAVERAWDAGITVVVSAGNLGPGPRTVSKPGDDPWVITVGAVDDRGTANLADDEVPNFSAHGPTAGDGLPKPDVVAPGAHIASLRAPGSAIDTEFPTYLDGTYRKGSGTSMAAAVVSGTLALMTQAEPTATPNRLKYALTATARPAASSDRMAVGKGVIDTYRAALAAPPGLANKGLVRSTGLGSLELDRGGVRVSVQNESTTMTVLTGLLTAQLSQFDTWAYATTEWSGRNWQSSQFEGRNWQTTSWSGSTWQGRNWQGSNWQSARWYGRNWQGSAWYGAWE